MSEEVANCPLCKKKPFPYHYEDHIEYVHCGVKCEDEGTWNRYAAAMESQLKLDELRTAVFAMLAVLSKGVFDPGEYFDHDVRVMRAKEFSAARKAVEEML